MTSTTRSESRELHGLLCELGSIRSDMVRSAAALRGREADWSLASRRNLAHYLVLRRRDVRPLQDRLSKLGLSSLGRCESHVLATVDALIHTLSRLCGKSAPRSDTASGPGFVEGPQLLTGNAEELLGPRPAHRATRIMVTLETEAATRPALVEELVAAGTDIVRINCAHDGEEVWGAMIANVRRASERSSRRCLIHMDMGGPKVRTVGERTPPLTEGALFCLRKSADPSVAPEGMPSVACSIPSILDMVRPGEPVWFDDGKLGGVIERVDAQGVVVRTTYVQHGHKRLKAERGINFPESNLDLAAFTDQDRRDLEYIATEADSVGISFLQTSCDVRAVRSRLVELGKPDLGVILKIETRRGFQELPTLLDENVGLGPMGVMIARGDLAIEIGYERLAEVQEEILWLCEAAYVPAIWATQVLESLSKEGMPSRAEITDAAMGERAECVMLNKGAHIVETVRTLDGILRRMAAHQRKKTAMLRALRVSQGESH